MSLTIKVRQTGKTLARGDVVDGSATIHEGCWYFPEDQVDMTDLVVTERTFTCPYKGVSYWVDMHSEDAVVRNVAWVYPKPGAGFESIAGRIGFYGDHTANTLAVKADGALMC